MDAYLCWNTLQRVHACIICEEIVKIMNGYSNDVAID